MDATPEKTTLTGTDLEMSASVNLPAAQCDSTASFLLPFDRLQSMARKFSSKTVLHIEPQQISCDLGTGRVSESMEAPKIEEFPTEPTIGVEAVSLPETFSRRFAEAMGCSSTDTTRYILNGVQLDVDGPKNAGHYLVGTNGRHLFSTNSFVLPLKESVIIPNHKLLLWRGLIDITWALASETKDDTSIVRIVAGDSRIRSIRFDRDERPTRATVWTKYGIVKAEWIEVAGDRCWFTSGTGDAKREAVPALERIELMCQSLR